MPSSFALYPNGLGSVELLSDAPINWSTLMGYYQCDKCGRRDQCSGRCEECAPRDKEGYD